MVISFFQEKRRIFFPVDSFHRIPEIIIIIINSEKREYITLPQGPVNCLNKETEAENEAETHFSKSTASHNELYHNIHSTIGKREEVFYIGMYFCSGRHGRQINK